MNSRQCVNLTLTHQAPDRIPLDLGGSAVTGMHVSSVYLLRQALHLDPPGMPVKVVEPYQMLGEIHDLMEALGVDVVQLGSPRNFFGSPQQVYTQVQENMRIFGRRGGFVFNTIHNVQARVPVENLLGLYQAVRDFR
jgi:hypothetical protein